MVKKEYVCPKCGYKLGKELDTELERVIGRRPRQRGPLAGDVLLCLGCGRALEMDEGKRLVECEEAGLEREIKLHIAYARWARREMMKR